MRKPPALFVALALALSGCSFSSIDPDASVSVTGRALDASGRPLAGRQVLLVKQADLGEVLFGTVFLVGSLTTICLLPDPPAICHKARKATTDSDGRFGFELKGDDTQGSLGTEATLSVTFAGGKATGSTTVTFKAKDPTITLPDARLARLAPKVTRRNDQLRVSWKPLPKTAGSKAAYSAQVSGDDGGTLWNQAAAGSTATIDARVLEDRSGAVAVSAGATLSGGSGGGTVRASYLSTSLPVQGTAGAPPSRGKPCAPVSGTAPANDGAFTTCAVTDGDLATPARLSGGDKVVCGVAVDLGRRQPVRLVVARGFSGQFVVEVSADGKAYRTVATSSGSAVAVVPQGQPTARFVRLRSPTGLDQSLSSEVSVW